MHAVEEIDALLPQTQCTRCGYPRCREYAEAVADGRADALVVDEASAALGLPDSLARRYLARLRDPGDGLVPDGRVDLAAMETVVGLRRRYASLGDDVLDPARGLIEGGG
jgi:hypothetical protein